MYFAHKLAQLPEPAIAAIAMAGQTDTHRHRHTHSHTNERMQTFACTHTLTEGRHVVMSYDMLCRKSEQYLCLERKQKKRKHTHTQRICMQDARLHTGCSKTECTVHRTSTKLGELGEKKALSLLTTFAPY